MTTIVFASMNPKKVEEIQRMAPKYIKVLCLKDIPEAQGIPQAEEIGKTFIENATIKAKYWAKKLNMPVLAEDSGIEILALDGYPGVYTKRCIDQLRPGANINEDNPDELYPLLLELIDESGKNTTEAKWVSSMAYIDGTKELYTYEAIHGNMCPCAGTRVFGFDQYFKPKGSTKTLSQMSPEEKDEIGPRLKALKNIFNNI
ncbi:MAG: non-canonical purine NTP pyrophosphatase [Clostridia bacterium]|nr:non-canonical purine NTP pyrophosphatase [Clostridia bacterium]